MKVAVLGLGIEGISSLQHWQSAGHDVTICDQNPDLDVPEGVNGQLGPDYLKGLDSFDVIVRTAGMHPGKIVAANTPEILDKVTSATNEFYRLSPSNNIIGVTGTKGKGTTSTLIYEMLKAAGKTVHLGGNIGISALDLLQKDIQPDDWVVLEQSSFQLIDQKHSPHIGVCLMVVPEHLDWHEDLEEYIAAKQQLFINQVDDDIAIYYAENGDSESIAAASEGRLVPYMAAPGAEVKNGAIVIGDTEICKTSDIKLLGEHNQQNVCAAVTTVWQIVQNAAACKKVISTFAGLEYRLELVRELDGVQYYNDSFGTTPETAIVAIKAFEQPKVLILGGSDKGASYDELAKTVASSSVKTVVLIGKTAPAIKAALIKAGFTNIVDGGLTMAEIIKTARSAAEPGDVVLLSTACASFDMFKSYKDRGQQFTSAVTAL
jgi:UDP-N-acetylmuramoylalanine--D-glutamate ligase